MDTRNKRRLEIAISIYQKCSSPAEAVSKISSFLVDTYSLDQRKAQLKAIGIVKMAKEVKNGKEKR